MNDQTKEISLTESLICAIRDIASMTDLSIYYDKQLKIFTIENFGNIFLEGNHCCHVRWKFYQEKYLLALGILTYYKIFEKPLKDVETQFSIDLSAILEIEPDTIVDKNIVEEGSFLRWMFDGKIICELFDYATLVVSSEKISYDKMLAIRKLCAHDYPSIDLKR